MEKLHKQLVLQNDIVTLRAVTLDDAPQLLRAGAFPEIWTHMSNELTTLERVESFIDTMDAARQRGTAFSFVVIDNATNEIVGSTSYSDIDTQHRRLEVGYTWYTPAVWRSAINTNCKYVLLQFAIEELEMQRVQIKTGHENERSQRAIERLGATKEGILRNHMIQRNGKTRHTVMYSVTAEDWYTRVKAHFETTLLLPTHT